MNVCLYSSLLISYVERFFCLYIIVFFANIKNELRLLFETACTLVQLVLIMLLTF